MQAFVRFYLARFIWITMAAASFHTTADCSRAQHEFFDTTVIEKWKAYEEFSHRIQGTSRSEFSSNGKPTELIYRFKQNRECALFIIPYNRDPSWMSYALVNPHYEATINRSLSDPENVVLQKYTPRGSDTDTVSIIDAVFFETSRHFCYGKTVRLRQAVSDPSFKVTKVAKEVQNGEELIRIDHVYDYVEHMPNNDIRVHKDGSLWLDPSRCWCIRRFKSSTQGKFHDDRTYETEAELVSEVTDHPSGYPILKSRTERFSTFQPKDKRKFEGTSKTDYELEVSENVPDSEFTLSAFGLPEPAELETVKKPIPLYIWILCAAGACAVGALAFRILARRRRLTETS